MRIYLIVVAMSVVLCTACTFHQGITPTTKKVAEGAESPRSVSPAAAASESRSMPVTVPQQQQPSIYDAPVRLADLEDRSITESSGIAASRRYPGLFWTHNDSGDAALLYAFDRQGKRRGVWRVAGATAQDWEDMAIGPAREEEGQPASSYLYLGDIGDNDKVRDEIVVYRTVEPLITPRDAASTKTNPRHTTPAEAIRLRYPDGPQDAEALLVHPTTGDLYIITKTFAARCKIYKAAAPLAPSKLSVALVPVGELQLPNTLGSLVTGGDISPDGTRVVLCDYAQGYELRLQTGASSRRRSFDSIWRQQPTQIPLGPRQQGEAICYRDDGQAILATSERRPTPLIEVVRRR